jgi:3D (Asp-Asp-Asp) domain-containing protein/predicted  nucleic acid-binding Zn-ribbon protein
VLGPVALTVLLPAAGAQRREPAASLRATQQQLSRQEQSALLDLYSLEAQLAQARGRVAEIERRQAALEQVSQAMQRDLVGVTLSMDAAQQELQQQLRRLYEQPSPDPIAVVLGAQSLNEALTSIDNLERVARQSSNIVHETRATRERLHKLKGQLEVQRARLTALRASALAETASLDAATASRRAFVGSLQRKKALTAGALARLEHRAAQAARKSVTQSSTDAQPVSATTTGGSTDGATTVATTTSPDGARSMRVEATAYALPGHTATGLPVGHGVAAVDPNVIPLGTRFEVPGYGVAVAADVGSGIRGAEIDLWFPTEKAARNWGRRLVTITFK